MRIATLIILLVLNSNALACLRMLHVSDVPKPATTMNRLDFTFAGKLVSFESVSMSDEEFVSLVSRMGEDHAISIRRQVETALLLTFEVSSVWKGQVGTPFLVRYNINTGCRVTPPVPIGDLYIVFGPHGAKNNTLQNFLSGEKAEAARPQLDRGY